MKHQLDATHQVGVSFELYYDAQKHKIKKILLYIFIYFKCFSLITAMWCNCALIGEKVFLDINPVIYYAEKHNE